MKFKVLLFCILVFCSQIVGSSSFVEDRERQRGKEPIGYIPEQYHDTDIAQPQNINPYNNQGFNRQQGRHFENFEDYNQRAPRLPTERRREVYNNAQDERNGFQQFGRHNWRPQNQFVNQAPALPGQERPLVDNFRPPNIRPGQNGYQQGRHFPQVNPIFHGEHRDPDFHIARQTPRERELLAENVPHLENRQSHGVRIFPEDKVHLENRPHPAVIPFDEIKPVSENRPYHETKLNLSPEVKPFPDSRFSENRPYHETKLNLSPEVKPFPDSRFSENRQFVIKPSPENKPLQENRPLSDFPSFLDNDKQLPEMKPFLHRNKPFQENREIPENRPFPENSPLPENRPFLEKRPLPENRPFLENRQIPENRAFSENMPRSENRPSPEHRPYQENNPHPDSRPAHASKVPVVSYQEGVQHAEMHRIPPLREENQFHEPDNFDNNRHFDNQNSPGFNSHSLEVKSGSIVETTDSPQDDYVQRTPVISQGYEYAENIGDLHVETGVLNPDHKRFMIIHQNGTIEYLDNLDAIQKGSRKAHVVYIDADGNVREENLNNARNADSSTPSTDSGNVFSIQHDHSESKAESHAVVTPAPFAHIEPGFNPLPFYINPLIPFGDAWKPYPHDNARDGIIKTSPIELVNDNVSDVPPTEKTIQPDKDKDEVTTPVHNDFVRPHSTTDSGDKNSYADHVSTNDNHQQTVEDDNDNYKSIVMSSAESNSHETQIDYHTTTVAPAIYETTTYKDISSTNVYYSETKDSVVSTGQNDDEHVETAVYDILANTEVPDDTNNPSVTTSSSVQSDVNTVYTNDVPDDKALDSDQFNDVTVKLRIPTDSRGNNTIGITVEVPPNDTGADANDGIDGTSDSDETLELSISTRSTKDNSTKTTYDGKNDELFENKNFEIDLTTFDGSPSVWFKTTDDDILDKLKDDKEPCKIVYFFKMKPQPYLVKETNTTIHKNGTIITVSTESIYENKEDLTPKVTKTTTITHVDDRPH